MADCGVVGTEAVREKVAFDWPDAIVNEAGTNTYELLLAKLTVSPLLSAAVFKATVQRSEPGVMIEPVAHHRLLTTGTPLPFRPTLRA
jgi:hypothetical protein